MSSFWAKRLGTEPATAPAAPVPPAAPAGPWWMTPAAQPAAPQQPVVPQAPQMVPASQINGEQHLGDLMHQENYTPTKAQSARDTERCPDCNSGNFIAPQGHPNALKQCFDCGWNARFTHSTHGASATSKDIPMYTARGQTMTENNFNPQGIIAHVG